LIPPRALAEPLRQSIIVSIEPHLGEPLPREWPSMLRRALAVRLHRNVLGAKTLAERLRTEGHRGRRSGRTLALLRKDADAVFEAAAFGRDSEAISRGQLLLTGYRQEMDALGASDDAARAIADTCLFVVRALLHQLNVDGARVQARECARLVPDLVISKDVHPPEVEALFASVRSEPPLGRLSVRAETSKATDCLVRLQGRPVAKLPATLDLVPGAYAVQAECEQVGFVRDVQIDPNLERQLDTAPELEASIRAEAVGFDYPDAPALAAPWRAGLALLLRWSRADEIWTLERRAGGMHIRLFQREGDELVELGERVVPALPADTLESRVQAAVTSLGGGNLKPEEPRSETSEANQTLLTLAAISAIGGTLAIAGSWLAFARTSNLDAELETMTYDDSTYADVLERRDTFRTLALVSTTAGSALVAGTALAWLPRNKSIPWWAIAAGAGGAVAAGFGTVLWTQHGELETARCPDGEACLRPVSTVPLGPMLLTQGLALMSLPATYFVRGSASPAAAVDLRASGSMLAIMVRGAL